MYTSKIHVYEYERSKIQKNISVYNCRLLVNKKCTDDDGETHTHAPPFGYALVHSHRLQQLLTQTPSKFHPISQIDCAVRVMLNINKLNRKTTEF